MKFLTEILVDLAYENEENGYKVIENKLLENDCWTSLSRLVFSSDEYPGRFFLTHYRDGLTEYQEEYPFENEGEYVDCKEVFKKELKTYFYLTKEGCALYDEK